MVANFFRCSFNQKSRRRFNPPLKNSVYRLYSVADIPRINLSASPVQTRKPLLYGFLILIYARVRANVKNNGSHQGVFNRDFSLMGSGTAQSRATSFFFQKTCGIAPQLFIVIDVLTKFF